MAYQLEVDKTTLKNFRTIKTEMVLQDIYWNH
ncbi:uncharacterized protein METZ01_LOCUS80240 [marine metagenome]|uniref:Uncharacterized protein n=1 Tax=marine metagenome TaxID=408172 RepID=A0A381UGS0_9ZZZZ